MTDKKEIKTASRSNEGGFIVENREIVQELKEINSGVKKLININEKKEVFAPKKNIFPVQEIPVQPKTLEICPKCGDKCFLKVTDYRNIRCWQVKCQGCDYFSYASTKRK